MRMDAQIKQWVKGGVCSVTEVAGLLGVSRDTVLRMVRDGSLIGWKLRGDRGKILMYRRQVLEYAARRQSEAIKVATCGELFDWGDLM